MEDKIYHNFVLLEDNFKIRRGRNPFAMKIKLIDFVGKYKPSNAALSEDK